MNPTPPPRFVPPRPNLGPEPLSTGGPLGWLVLAVIVACLLVAFAWLLRRLVRARTRFAEVPISHEPADEMTAWSRLVREALARRFGDSWLAKTTEEIAAAPVVAEALGRETTEHLAGFLTATDRLRFADFETVPPEARERYRADWEGWVAGFVVGIADGQEATPSEGRSEPVGPNPGRRPSGN